MRHSQRTGRWWVAAALVAGALALTGCTGSGGTSSSPDSGPPAKPGPVSEPGPVSGPGVLGGKDAPITGAGIPPTSPDRQVISQGSMSITAKDPIRAADDAVRIVERTGGRIDSRTEQPPVGGRDGSAQLLVRIPSARLTATLDEVKKLGTVRDVAINTTDVTTQTRDLDARIVALQTSVDRLLALLAKATTTADLITIESALADRQSNLESLQAQRRALADQVDLATISLGFGSEATAPIDTPRNFFSGIATGWEALVAFVGAALIGLGVVLPWLVIASVIAAIAVLLVRRRRRRTPPASTMGE